MASGRSQGAAAGFMFASHGSTQSLAIEQPFERFDPFNSIMNSYKNSYALSKVIGTIDAN